MNKRSIVELVIKVFGAYFFMQAIIFFRETIVSILYLAFEGQEGGFYMAIQWVETILNITIGLFLIFKSNWILDLMRIKDDEKLILPLEKVIWIELIIITLSFLFILQSLPGVLDTLRNFVFANPYDKGEKELFWTTRKNIDIGYLLIKIAVSLYCLLNAKKLANRLVKVNDKNQPEVSAE